MRVTLGRYPGRLVRSLAPCHSRSIRAGTAKICQRRGYPVDSSRYQLSMRSSSPAKVLLRPLGAFAAALVLAAASPRSDEVIPFQELARSFREANCAQGASCDLQSIVARNYLRIPLGVFELCYPTRLIGEKERASDLQQICDGMLRLQGVWLRWLAQDPELQATAQADIDTLLGWVEGWHAAKLRGLEKDGPSDFLTLVESGADTRAALERLSALMLDGERLGLAPKSGAVIQILCSPTRLDFMQFVGYCGTEEPALKQAYWVPGIDQWTQIWKDSTLILGLEYAPWGALDIQFEKGLSMKKFDKTGLVEHTTEQATLALLRFCELGREISHFEKALAMNMTIEVCGQVNTVDSEGGIATTGAHTAPYSRFVPGGNPNGGSLPPIPAAPYDSVQDNQWREGHGRDHFAKPLRKGQKAGAKRAPKDKTNPQAKDKVANFLLIGGPSHTKVVVSAPFFGALANEKQYPPQEVLIEYRQFFRAYKSGFYDWVRTKSDADELVDRAHFRALLQGLDELDAQSTSWESLVERVYGLPLSAKDGSSESLEWRYMTWLGK